MKFTVKTVFAVFAMALLFSGSAHADVGAQSGCSLPPCGALDNQTSSWVSVRWSDDGTGWTYASVRPGTQKGGYWHDGIDVDEFYVDVGCRATTNGWLSSYGHGWHKISSYETVRLNGYKC